MTEKKKKPADDDDTKDTTAPATSEPAPEPAREGEEKVPMAGGHEHHVDHKA